MTGSDPLIPDEETVKGFQMKEGKVVMVTKEGLALPLDHYMKLKNGTVVEMDGTIVKKDATRDSLKEGAMILINGQMGN